MKNNQKSTWGSASDWGTAIGIGIAIIGLLSLISSVWTPDAAASAATGFLGSNSITPSVIILVLGALVAGVFRFFVKSK